MNPKHLRISIPMAEALREPHSYPQNFAYGPRSRVLDTKLAPSKLRCRVAAYKCLHLLQLDSCKTIFGRAHRLLRQPRSMAYK